MMKEKTGKARSMIIVGKTGSGHERVVEECERLGAKGRVRTALPNDAAALKKKPAGLRPVVIYIKASLDPGEERFIRQRRLGARSLAEDKADSFDFFEHSADYIFSFSREDDLGKICEAVRFLLSGKV